jgi:ABC-type transport system substrate-binding protein
MPTGCCGSAGPTGTNPTSAQFMASLSRGMCSTAATARRRSASAPIKRNELDIAMPLSQTAFEEAAAQSRYVKGWSDKFPWEDLDDPCDNGIHFYDSKYPFNDPLLRSTLALAIDIDAASVATLSGALRVTPLGAPPTAELTRAYYEPMQQWLRNFELPDGFKPFDLATPCG